MNSSVDFLKRNFDFALLALILLVFISVASIRLGESPVPDKADESFTLQVSYEMLNRGQLSLPMYRLMGGNIENVWHSYTPVYFVLLSGFLELTGFGLTEGRAFNLMTAAMVLVMVFLISRRLFDWRAAVFAVLLLASDNTIFERSRFVRNDFAAAAFALLAFYLYERAEESKRVSLFVATGLATGTAVMCHTNALYMLAVIALLIIVKRGRQFFRSREFYIFLAAAFAVCAYEIIYDIIDRENFALQNRDDTVHFKVFRPWGWWENILREGGRYVKWYRGGKIFPQAPHVLLHLFQALAIIALIYLIIIAARSIKQKAARQEPRLRLLVATMGVVIFHAAITSHKTINYIAHLAPWFAICSGVLLSDALKLLPKLRSQGRSRLIYRAVVVCAAIAALLFGYQFVKLNRAYAAALSNPDQASFEEFRAALREIIPEDVCPASKMLPTIWLAFPEKDRCYVTIERRMMRRLDIDGREYAIVMPKKQRRFWKHGTSQYHLIGELEDTPYGDLRVYYTGNDAKYRSLTSKRFKFFKKRRGYLRLDETLANRPD
jgi:4-amino-4-deoxy-L-arabinose transferase-like glycosyltransferase